MSPAEHERVRSSDEPPNGLWCVLFDDAADVWYSYDLYGRGLEASMLPLRNVHGNLCQWSDIENLSPGDIADHGSPVELELDVPASLQTDLQDYAHSLHSSEMVHKGPGTVVPLRSINEAACIRSLEKWLAEFESHPVEENLYRATMTRWRQRNGTYITADLVNFNAPFMAKMVATRAVQMVRGYAVIGKPTLADLTCMATELWIHVIGCNLVAVRQSTKRKRAASVKRTPCLYSMRPATTGPLRDRLRMDVSMIVATACAAAGVSTDLLMSPKFQQTLHNRLYQPHSIHDLLQRIALDSKSRKSVGVASCASRRYGNDAKLPCVHNDNAACARSMGYSGTMEDLSTFNPADMACGAKVTMPARGRMHSKRLFNRSFAPNL